MSRSILAKDLTAGDVIDQPGSGLIDIKLVEPFDDAKTPCVFLAYTDRKGGAPNGFTLSAAARVTLITGQDLERLDFLDSLDQAAIFFTEHGDLPLPARTDILVHLHDSKDGDRERFAAIAKTLGATPDDRLDDRVIIEHQIGRISYRAVLWVKA